MPSSQNDIGIFANTVTPRDLGFTSVALPVATVVTLPAIPVIVNVLLIQCNQPMRYLDNGVDSASTTDGILIPATVPFEYQVSDFSLITFALDASASGAGTIQVLGYSYATRAEV